MAPLRELLHLDIEVQVPEDLSISSLEAPSPTFIVTDQRRLKIQVLGEPLVTIDNIPIIHWRMKRSLETFLFLLNQGRPTSKEQIVTALWPEINDKTNPTFHSIIYHLRKTIGESCIISHAGIYSLNLVSLYGNNVWYDVAAFEKHYKKAKHALIS